MSRTILAAPSFWNRSPMAWRCGWRCCISSVERTTLSNLLITNARVVDPSQELDAKLDLLIEDGVVTHADKRIKADVETIDATGLIAVPGLIDLHTHLREPGQEHKETIATGTRAAVA